VNTIMTGNLMEFISLIKTLNDGLGCVFYVILVYFVFFFFLQWWWGGGGGRPQRKWPQAGSASFGLVGIQQRILIGAT
jgi:hypothetical protein